MMWISFHWALQLLSLPIKCKSLTILQFKVSLFLYVTINRLRRLKESEFIFYFLSWCINSTQLKSSSWAEIPVLHASLPIVSNKVNVKQNQYLSMWLHLIVNNFSNAIKLLGEWKSIEGKSLKCLHCKLKKKEQKAKK